MENSNAFSINNKGVCLLCFNESSENRSEEVVPTSFLMITKYINLDLRKAFNMSSSMPYPEQWKDKDVIIPVCQECLVEAELFCGLYKELEAIQRQLNKCVETLYCTMTRAETLSNEYPRRLISSRYRDMPYKDSFRQEAINKCKCLLDKFNISPGNQTELSQEKSTCVLSRPPTTVLLPNDDSIVQSESTLRTSSAGPEVNLEVEVEDIVIKVDGDALLYDSPLCRDNHFEEPIITGDNDEHTLSYINGSDYDHGRTAVPEEEHYTEINPALHSPEVELLYEGNGDDEARQHETITISDSDNEDSGNNEVSYFPVPINLPPPIESPPLIPPTTVRKWNQFYCRKCIKRLPGIREIHEKQCNPDFTMRVILNKLTPSFIEGVLSRNVKVKSEEETGLLSFVKIERDYDNDNMVYIPPPEVSLSCSNYDTVEQNVEFGNSHFLYEAMEMDCILPDSQIKLEEDLDVVGGWATTGELANHMDEHRGETPYICGECGKRFCQNSALKAHYMTVHFLEV